MNRYFRIGMNFLQKILHFAPTVLAGAIFITDNEGHPSLLLM